MCPSRDILGTLQVGTGWGPDALGELQWKTVPSRLPHKTPQMGQLVNDKHDFSALWHPASPGSAVWRSSSCPLLVPLTAPSPGRRDVGFLWVLKQEGKGSFSRDQIACLGLEKVKTGKSGQKDNNPKVQCLEFSLVNLTNTYRDLLCARHCARCWGFKEALRSTEGTH